MAAKTMTHDEFFQIIQRRYRSSGCVVLPEVRDGTGHSTRGREADALVFGVWPSRGLTIHGIEIKTHRGDWLHELKQPEKAESIAQFCDYWTVCTVPGVAKAEDMPATWGLSEFDGKKWKDIKLPEKMEPKEINRTFLMSVMRNVEKNYVPKHAQCDIEKLAEGRVQELVASLKRDHAYEISNIKSRADSDAKALDEFEKASGIDLRRGWGTPPARWGAVAKILLEKDKLETLKSLVNDALRMRSLSQILDRYEQAVFKAPEIETMVFGVKEPKNG
ncbi:MAG: hypothetical protein PHP45_03475 [Elusimicrobiales bacterium]|nr:hypothetical protein [Elusimicrobiales bacterium]